MIITCPACSTRYSMDPTSLGPEGRRVRCAKCKHVWQQTPPDDMPKRVDLAPPEPAPAPAPTVAPVAMAASSSATAASALGGPSEERVAIPPRPRPAPRTGMGAGLGILILLIVIIGLAAGAGYLFQKTVVASWPDAREIYDALGIAQPVLGKDLEISNITFVNQTIDGQPVLVVHGEIFNKGQATANLPNLLATLRTQQRQWLFDWIFAIDKRTLAPGETVTFTTTAKTPPKDAKLLEVTFTEKPVGS
ncbi:MAG: zinc-ribbon domain-containing protein [Hypericibacter sp.]